MTKPQKRRELLCALEPLPDVKLIASRSLSEGSKPAGALDLVRCHRPRAYLVILSSARGSLVLIQEFASYHDARYCFETEGARPPLPEAVAAVLKSPLARRRSTLIRELLNHIPGVDRRHIWQRRWNADLRRFERVELIQCLPAGTKRPRAHLVIESWRDQVLHVEEFAGYLEAWYYFDTHGAPVELLPAVAALVR